LLDRPHLATFITMPAPNIGAMPAGSPDIERVVDVLENRITCVVSAAVTNDLRCMVLGAWGCGVFRNDPDLVARLFSKTLSKSSEQSLGGEATWRSFFDRIVFAVFDTTADARTRRAFETHLASL
jgi:uncharacterized protein (TIGR02452 family)